MNRQGVACFAVLGLIVATGCVGLVMGDGLEMESEPAAVSDAAVEETSFRFAEHRTIRLNETIEVLGAERQINATNHATIYNTTTALDRYDRDTGGFVVITTPDVSIRGQSVNPAARMSNKELVDRFRGEIESEVGELGELTAVGNRTEPVLGYAANVSVFETRTTIQDMDVTLFVHVTTVRHGGDLVIGIGVHPEALQQQAPEIHQLMRGIEHPVSLSSVSSADGQ